jgi:phosphohistidine swiveling domain-containing protein
MNAGQLSSIKKLVLPFEAVIETDKVQVGGKGYTLARLAQLGYPVPPGFCLTRGALQRHLTANGLDEAAQRILEGGDSTALKALQRAVIESPLPSDVLDALRTGWRQLGNEDRPLAVRSSSLMEDGQRVSFAGQHETLLDVRGEEMLTRAVKTCWASLWSDRATDYRAHLAGASSPDAMGVVVQVMVLCDWAGVAFTRDPAAHDDDCLVLEAIPGQGEALVAGKVSPRRYWMSRTTGQWTAPPAGGDSADGRPPDDLIQQVADLALRVEQALSAPQDVEWAWSGERLYLLQARPITTGIYVSEAMEDSRSAPSKKRSVLWTRENVGEVVPDVITPLTWSVMDSLSNDGAHALLRRFGLPVDRSTRLFELFYGRVYLNETQLQDIFHAFYISELDRRASGGRRWLRRLGAGAFLAQLALRTAWAFASLPGELEHFVRRLQRTADANGRGRMSATEPTLADQLGEVEHWLQVDQEGMRIHLAVTVLASLLYTLLEKLVIAWRPSPNLPVAHLVTGLDGMQSARMGLALRDLARRVATDPEARAILMSLPTEAIPTALQQTPAGRRVWFELAAFLEQHGHSSLREFELAFPRWREAPTYVVAILQNYLQADQLTSGDAVHQGQVAVRRDAERRMRRALNRGLERVLPTRRLLFEVVLHLAQRYSVRRENAKYHFVLAHGQLRQAYLTLADRLMAQGLLDEVSDIFFLTWAEIGILAQGKITAADRRAWVSERRRTQERHQRLEPPAAIERLPDGQYRTTLVTPPPSAATLSGLGASAGRAMGRARVVLDPACSARLEPGEILIAPTTNPAWAPLFLAAGALVTEVGGLLSHAAIVAREYGLPAVLNVPGATTRIHDGQLVMVDGETGVVQVLEG